jgi:transcriptional regulator with XRE-family HTH domain
MTMALNPALVGNTIRTLRKSRGLTQAKLSERAGVTKNHLGLVENGQRGVSLESLNALANALRVPSEVILFLAGDGKHKWKEFEEVIQIAKEGFLAAIKAETERS